MKGRSIVALLLAGFVLMAAAVIWRRAAGLSRAREENRLAQQRTALDAERTRLFGDIRALVGREALARVAEERLHMRVPSDSQVVFLARPQPARTADRARAP